MRINRLFNDGWQFSKFDLATSLANTNSSDVVWKDVEIPHDWLIYNTNALYEDGEGWYRKNFTIESLDDKVFSIYFEGVYMNSTIYVNGEVAGEWKYGYSSFELDISKLLKIGDNEIKVQVVHRSPNSRWYSGAGIYRSVWLRITALSHLVSDGIYISTSKNSDRWTVLIDSEAVINQVLISSKENIKGSKENSNISIKQTIIDKGGNVIAEVSDSLKELSNDVNTLSQTIEVKNPSLWTLDNPYLYELKTDLVIDGLVVDRITQKFGFRTLRFDKNEGFFLNDSYVKLHGACMHHDLGSLGAAMNVTALRRQFAMLKEMGINSIRTAHNMPAVEYMDLADEMGILIVSEAFDMWERSKTTHDYSNYFKEWHAKDVASWVRRDRNHPSIIMWSIGNEIYDTHIDDRGREVTIELRKLVELHDPRKNGLVTFGSNFLAWENTQKAAHEVEVVGYNYSEYLYDSHHEKYPDWIIYGSETASTVQSRGIYHFPLAQPMLANDDEQCSSLGNCTTSWGAKSTEKTIIDDRDAKFCLGQYIWTGWDYIGEPTPYQTKNSYFGQIDTAGFKKDAFYIYQAEWTSYKDNPMVHILPYWDFNEGQLIDVRVFSNAPTIELFFNDKSLGKVDIDHVKGKKLSGDWQIPYSKGSLKAVAYDENANVIATDIQSSFGDATEIIMEADKTELKADGEDLIFVTISSKDADGNYVANANNRIEVEVSGAGRLVGLDNGDSTDYDQYKGTSRRLFSGKLLAIIAAKFDSGDIKVKATSRGLKTSEITLKSVPAESRAGVSRTLVENTKSPANDEIPIRKINLINHGVNHFDKENTLTKVTAVIYPSNGTYNDIHWRAITPLGIDTNIAEIEYHGTEAVVTVKGDGEFRLRCYANNGREQAVIISELEFEATGLGNVNLDAYDFIPGGLYSASNCELSNGHERGVLTSVDVESHIGFRNVDFGQFGSDEVTLPIFYNSSEPLPIEIWEGMPGEEGSELIDKVHYQAAAKWSVYQENTFKLSRRLKGVTTLCFVVNEQIHLKGFQFTKINKAYQQLSALDNTRVFGDSFKITESAVENIGNNVVLEYEEMDFGQVGFSKILICGRSNTEVNTIHIRFHGDGGDVNQIVEFPYSEDFTEKEFDLKSVTGNQKVAFVFMPGSNFDFKWFRFS